MKRYEITVHGFVQGVGFRYFVHREALALGIKGYVKNQFDGTVFVVMEAESEVLNRMVDLLRVGPSHSHVDNIIIEETTPNSEFSQFEIR